MSIERRRARGGAVWVAIFAALLGVVGIVAVATWGPSVGQATSEVSTPISTPSWPIVTQIAPTSTTAPTTEESQAVVDGYLSALGQRGGVGGYYPDRKMIVFDYYGPDQADDDVLKDLASGFAVEVRFWGDIPGPQT